MQGECCVDCLLTCWAAVGDRPVGWRRMGNLKKQLDALTLRVDALEDKLTAVPGLINELRDRLNSLARVVGEGGGGGKAADLERLAERVKQVETLAANHTVELRDISKDTQANRTDIAGLTKRVSGASSHVGVRSRAHSGRAGRARVDHAEQGRQERAVCDEQARERP